LEHKHELEKEEIERKYPNDYIMQGYLHQDIENSYTEREIEIAKKQVEIESYMLCNGMLYGQEKEIVKYNIQQIAKNVVLWWKTISDWELSELKEKTIYISEESKSQSLVHGTDPDW